MIKNPTIQEFEAASTTRMLLGKRATKSSYSYKEAMSMAIFAVNSYLQDIEANKELWCMARGKRTYIFYLPSMRIAGELGFVSDRTSDDMHTNLRIVILDRKGLTRCKTLNDLITSAQRKPSFNHAKRKERR